MDTRLAWRWTVRCAAVVLVLTTPVATWWLVGDRSEPVPPGGKLSYSFRPLPLNPDVERAIGIAGVVLAGVAALLLVVASLRRHLDRRWWGVLGPVLVVGVIVGEGWRIMTAGTIGANFGAGFVVLFGGPAIAGLLLWAGWRWLRLRRSLHTAPDRRPE